MTQLSTLLTKKERAVRGLVLVVPSVGPVANLKNLELLKP
jgi:hypothetical protein